MFATLYSLTSPVAALVAIAELFTPRLEVVGPLVLLDVSGVSRLFGTPREMAEQMRRAAGGPVRIAVAPTQSAAALLALGRPGLVVIEPDQQRAALAQLPISVLGEFERLRLSPASSAPGARRTPSAPDAPSAPSAPSVTPPHVAQMEDVLPYFHHSLRRATDATAARHLAATASARVQQNAGSVLTAPSAPGAPSAPSAPRSVGWTHPRDAHAAAHTRRPRRSVTARRELEHAHPALASARTVARESRRNRTQEMAVEALLDTLRRWGIKTFGQLAVLPPGDVYERLGARGVLWQRLSRGDDSTPLVPWIPEDPFESSLDLEWPIEGLEPLSFVLGRLLEPLAERLERADRGAAILHTHLRLVDKTVHARMVQLPAPMRDPKTLRTLVLLDLESNPPSAGIDRVRVLIEPTPARVTQWALFERAQPSPEQVSTLLARLTALMGESHVGSPRLVDSWKPGAFEMTAFRPSAPGAPGAPGAPVAPRTRCICTCRPDAPDAPDEPDAPGAPDAS
jgi:nucleotidyltransferase/DNA polymerase involved in DNA repair